MRAARFAGSGRATGRRSWLQAIRVSHRAEIERRQRIRYAKRARPMGDLEFAVWRVVILGGALFTCNAIMVGLS